MGAIRHGLDRGIGALARLVLGIFFRRIEVVGRERLPASGPAILVGNHVNGLLDPMFLIGTLGVPARILGKHTLWKIPGLAQILDLAGVIPVARRGEGGDDPNRNAAAFARCYDELAAGGWIVLFPEGTSHDEPSLQPLRTGAARIALEAEALRGTPDRPLAVRIVPVGLFYDARHRFRSRVLVVVGASIPVPRPVISSATGDAEPADPDAALELTEAIAAGLESVTINVASWKEARWIEIGADLYDRDRMRLPRERRVAAEFAVRRAVAETYRRLSASHPDEVAAAIVEVKAYERLLQAFGFSDEQIASTYPLRETVRFTTRAVAWISALAAPAIVGLLAHAPPLLVVRGIAAAKRDEPNQIATYKVFPGLVVYPAAWAIEAALVARTWGGLAGGVALLALPLLGWIGLRWAERVDLLLREGRAFLRLATSRRLTVELARRRAAAIAAVARLAEIAGFD